MASTLVIGRCARSGPQWTRIVAGAVAGVLVLGSAVACSSHHRSVTVEVDPTRAVSVSLPGGGTLSVPVGAVAGKGKITARQVGAPSAAPGTLAVAGPVYDIRIEGTTIVHPVTLTLAVPALTGTGSSAGPDVAVLATHDPASGWQPVQASYDPGAHTITASTTQLAVWAALRLDAGRVLALGATRLRTLLTGTPATGQVTGGIAGGTTTTAQPTCQGSGDLAQRHITVTADGGDQIRWCVGVDGAGTPSLRVTNNRGYAIETGYSAAWKVRPLDPADPVLDGIVSGVAGRLAAPAAGTRVVLVPGGHSVEFAIAAGASGTADSRPSAAGYLTEAMAYALDMITLTVGAVPGVPAADQARNAKVVADALADQDCLAGVDRALGSPVTDGASAADLLRTALQVAVGCLSDGWQAAYGVPAPVAPFVTAILHWLVDGMGAVVDGQRSVVAGAVYWRSYRITVTLPVELTDNSVAGIRTGGSGGDVEQRLRQALGAPTKVEDLDVGCLIVSSTLQHRRYFTWGGLEVAVSDPGTAKAALVGWTVRTGALPSAVTLPYGVTTATSVRQALKAIPGASGSWDDTFQFYFVSTAAQPHMVWGGDKEDGSGTVGFITNDFEPCE